MFIQIEKNKMNLKSIKNKQFIEQNCFWENLYY